VSAVLSRSLPAATSALFRYLPIVILLLLWQFVSAFNLISTAVLPPLSSVLEQGYSLFLSDDFWKSTISSAYRGGMGLLLAIVVGAALGIAMAWWRSVRYVSGPLVEIFYPLPKSALIPVTAVWLGLGDGSKILLIFLGCMLPVTIGAFNGARGAEQTLIWSARSLGAGRWRTLFDVVVPSALPELLNGVRTALALSFILLVSAEMVASRNGLGYLIGFLGDGGNYEGMFAVVLVVAAIGFFADRVYLAFARWVLRWRE
jgi:ABC-type nitrate/sulfonate/bicarbonate transport system permease component